MAIYGLPDERLELILERYPKKIKEIREQVKKTLKEVNGKGELLDKEYSRVKFDFLKPNSLITLDLDLIKVSEKEKNAIQDELKLIHKRIINVLKEFADLREDHYGLVAVWIIGTYMHSEFPSYPYLFLNAMRGSGKTRLLKLIASMSYGGKILLSPTEAVMFRMPKGQTLCLDEMEGIGRKENGGVREMLNACYKKGSTVNRMKQVKHPDGSSEQVIEEFEPYKPLCLANIWGIEEVLGDRCVTIILEKSSRQDIMKILEDFDSNPRINAIKSSLNSILTQLSSYVDVVGSVDGWNIYIKKKYSSVVSSVVTVYRDSAFLSPEKPKYAGIEVSVVKTSLRHIINNLEVNTPTTPHTLTTLTTQTTQKEHPLLNLFKKIDRTGINGRNLELFFPLMMLSNNIGEEILDEILETATNLNKEKRKEEMTESKDVSVYDFVAKLPCGDYRSIKLLSISFRSFLGNVEDTEDKWINERWLGKAFKRLNLIVDKRRMAHGNEVVLNIDKAKKQMEMFK